MNRSLKIVLVMFILFIITVIYFSIAPALILTSLSSNRGPLWSGITYSLEPTDVYLKNITMINYTILSQSRELEWYALNITYKGNSIFFKNVTTNPEGGSIITNIDPANKTENIDVMTLFKRKGQDEVYWHRTYIIWWER